MPSSPQDWLGQAASLPGSIVAAARNAATHLTGLADPGVAQTPKTTLWQRKKVQLWRYYPLEERRGEPVVIVFSLLSRSYLFDLHPGNSFVEHLHDAGFDVYLLDWGVADAADSATRFDDLVDDYLPSAVRVAARDAGKDVTVIGYCFGGTMSVVSLAVGRDLPVKNLVLMAAPIDFSDVGLFSRLLGKGGA